MARLKAHRNAGHAKRIAVIEDDPGLLASLKALLTRDGHDVMGASDAASGVELVRSFRPNLTLLDYYMPGGTGADVVREIREFDRLGQVLLVTGYAAEQPARTLLAELDIQGYHDKADGPDRLLVLVDAALKHAAAIDRIELQRRNLAHIVAVSPKINRLQSARELLQTALDEVGVFFGGGNGIIATANHGLFILDQPTEGVSVHAATGRYAGMTKLSELPPPVGAAVLGGLVSDAPTLVEGGLVVIPLCTRGGDRGCMIVEALELPADTADACRMYAHQIVHALENVILYERATVDPLTGLYTRGFGLQRLEETLRLAWRTQTTTSVALIDIDRFKQVNDSMGHAAGDVALRGVAGALRGAARITDVVVRYGGEELLVVLPATDALGASIAAERLRAAIAAFAAPFEGRTVRVTASVGIATASPGESPDELLRRADLALYRAKSEGRDRVRVADGDHVRVA